MSCPLFCHCLLPVSASSSKAGFSPFKALFTSSSTLLELFLWSHFESHSVLSHRLNRPVVLCANNIVLIEFLAKSLALFVRQLVIDTNIVRTLLSLITLLIILLVNMCTHVQWRQKSFIIFSISRGHWKFELSFGQ